MDLIDIKLFWTIFHLFGVAIGAGGAYMSDIMFFSSIKDEKISATEMRFLKMASKFVWFGIAVLVLSGIGLFFTDMDAYLESSKFLAKVTIVTIIAINGIVFHGMHLPRIERHVGHHFPSSDEFMRHRPLLLVSGAVSFVSWTSVVILGALRSLPFDYLEILGFYLVIVTVAAFGALFIFKHRPTKN